MSERDPNTCTDCGCEPKHEDSPPGYCRRCSEKAGHRYAFYHCIDIDLLRAKVGRELAEQIVNECTDQFGCGQ